MSFSNVLGVLSPVAVYLLRFTPGDPDWSAIARAHHNAGPKAAGKQSGRGGRRKHAASAETPALEGEMRALVDDECGAEVDELQRLLEELLGESESQESDDCEYDVAEGKEGSGAKKVASSSVGETTVVASSSSVSSGGAAPASSSGSGLSAREKLMGLRANCVVSCKQFDTDTLCKELSVTKSEFPWRYTFAGEATGDIDIPDKELGSLQVTFAGQTVQCLCAIPKHKRCKLLLQVRSDMRIAEACMVRWLVQGISTDGPAHEALKATVRAQHKEMTTRG
jgi:hypothetical protein